MASTRLHLHLVGFAHVCLFVANALPLFIPCPTEPIIIYTAVLAVYIGSWRSVKTGAPEESMTKKDAMRFPFIGSLSLVSLFVMFKLLPVDAVNFVLSFYFLIIGCVATTATVLPLVQGYFPETLREKRFGPYKPRLSDSVINLIPSERLRAEIRSAQEDLELAATVPELIVGGVCSMACMVYMASGHWFFNNLLGLSLAIEGIEFLTITSTQTGILLFIGLFFYDIFWVFFTPVMVTVATSFNAPIKVVYPHPAAIAKATARPFALLGLGDIVIPGLVISLVLRYDMAHHAGRPVFFTSAMTGYTVALITTIVVMNIFQAAQPALLYIVPSVLGFVMVHSIINGELSKVFHYCEMKEHEKKNGEAKAESDERKDE